MVIGLPPVAHFAKPAVRDKVMRQVLTGEKTLCLAISGWFPSPFLLLPSCRLSSFFSLLAFFLLPISTIFFLL